MKNVHKNINVCFLIATLFFCIQGVCFAKNPEQGQIIRDCDGCPQLVVIPRGSFDMRFPPGTSGRGHNVGLYHTVTFDYAFAIGTFEVTNREWSECVSAGECADIVGESAAPRGAVVNVSWPEVNQYLRWLSKKTGFKYRLPSYSEWEYAARAGRGMNRYFNIDVSEICRHGNTYDQAAEKSLELGLSTTPCDDGESGVSIVGRYDPNQFGVYDVIGNVAEWIEDCAGPIVRAAYPRDGQAWLGGDCELRGFRGSSWLNNESSFVFESSFFRSLTSRADDLGFRVLREYR
jgi:formylglycine-generating enzyme required for sulfatase activity